MIYEILFFKICGFTSCFLFFYYFWLFNFNFIYLYLSKNSIYFSVLLFYGLEILSKNFGKLRNIFQKNIDIWNPKFFISSIVYYFFFYSFSILVIFFSYFTYPNLSKNSETFFWWFIVWIIDFIREFWKILELLLKKIEIL